MSAPSDPPRPDEPAIGPGSPWAAPGSASYRPVEGGASAPPAWARPGPPGPAGPTGPPTGTWAPPSGAWAAPGGRPGAPPGSWGPPTGQYPAPGPSTGQYRVPGPPTGQYPAPGPPPGWGGVPGPGYRPDGAPRRRGVGRVLAVLAVAALLVAALVTALLAFVVGPRFARTDVLDAAAVEQGVTRVVTDDWRRTITGVTCPEDQAVRTGTTFTCTATVDGRPQQVPVEVVDDVGTYSVGQPR